MRSTGTTMPFRNEVSIEHRPIDWPSIDPRTPRTHTKRQRASLEGSIRRFGLVRPILASSDGRIVDGALVWEAARDLGFDTIPTVVVDHLDKGERRALTLALNKIPEKSGWDAERVLEIVNESIELGIDMVDLGFDPGEVDAQVADLDEPPADSGEAAVPLVDRTKPAVTRLGDRYRLGRHHLLCEDCRAITELPLEAGQKIRMMIADPPYNVPVRGHVGGRGTIRHPEFAMASGEMSIGEFTAFNTEWLRCLQHHLMEGAIQFVFMDWRHSGELMEAAKSVGLNHLNTCVWVKQSPGQGSFYRSQHEFCHVFRLGDVPHLNTFGLGAGGRTRSNVWHYKGMAGFGPERQEALAMHPTVKPISMIIDAIKDVSKRGEVVLDPFSGSGTTIMAAERSGRIGVGIEIDPFYCDVAIRRWQTHTKRDAIHLASGLTFDERTILARDEHDASVAEDAVGHAPPVLGRPSEA